MNTKLLILPTAAAIQVFGAPTIDLSGPTTQLIAPATVNLSATAASSGTNNPITQVAFHNGTSLLGSTSVAPYAFSWTNVGAGTYSVTATATDSVGGTATSRAVEVRVISNVAPTVSVSANPEMATAPATITLTADAADSDGSIERVEFYHGTTLLGSVTQAPYSYTWSNVASGTYTVTAKAVDNVGAVTVSAPVTVRVAGAAARVYYIDSDQLNTPRVITDENNTVVWKWGNDDPFGGNLPEENPSGLGVFEFNLRFPGQYFDKETGLHDNWHRTYNPATGRYEQSDPIGLRGGINTYAYVEGNPVLLIDPEGLRGVRKAQRGGNAYNRRQWARHSPSPVSKPPGANNIEESAGYYDDNGEFVCTRWKCPQSPNMCTSNDIKKPDDWMPPATDPNSPPAGCSCDIPGYQKKSGPKPPGQDEWGQWSNDMKRWYGEGHRQRYK